MSSWHEQRPVRWAPGRGRFAARPPRGSHKRGQSQFSLSLSDPSILLTLPPLLTTALSFPTASAPPPPSCDGQVAPNFSWSFCPSSGLQHPTAQSPFSIPHSAAGTRFCARPQKVPWPVQLWRGRGAGACGMRESLPAPGVRADTATSEAGGVSTMPSPLGIRKTEKRGLLLQAQEWEMTRRTQGPMDGWVWREGEVEKKRGGLCCKVLGDVH